MRRRLAAALKGTRVEGPLRHLQMRIQAWRGEAGAAIDARAFKIMKRRLRRDSNCIDIGCAQGLYLHEMLRLAPARRYMAFEPIPDLYRNLQARFGRFPNVSIHNLALSDEEGTAMFHWNVQHSGWSGLKVRHYPDERDRVEVTDVQLKRLDDLVGTDHNVDLIKIDVEGAELKVLQGTRETLARCRPLVIFEYGMGSAELYEAWPERVLDLLDDVGLAVTPLDAYLEGDLVYERTQFLRDFHEHRHFYFVAHPEVH